MGDADTGQVVEGFLQAIEQRDFDRARGYLSSGRFSYVGPTTRFDSADAFIADISRVGPILHTVSRRKTFLDGNDICVILDFTTTLEELRQVRVAEWLHVESGRITSIEVFFDAYAYRKMFEA